MLRLAPIIGRLPADFPGLRAAAEAEGHRHLTRLEAEWASGAQRFDGAGEALIEARWGDTLVGVGGVTREPSDPEGGALRMRRFYVEPSARGQGVGRAIFDALAQRTGAALVTVHAGSADAGAFWERLGFAAVEGQPWSHALPPHSAS